jgi:acyl carrier protein
MSVMSELQYIFRKTFNDDSLAIAEKMAANDIDDWDSLSHVNLVIEAEKHFGIRFSTTEISLLENVGQFADVIRSKTGRS